MIPSGGKKSSSPKRNRPAAFTRLELLAVLVAVALVAAGALPALAASNVRSRVVHCLNNLRQTGRGYQRWLSPIRNPIHMS